MKAVVATLAILCGSMVGLASDDRPVREPEPRYAMSLSLALKAIKGESVDIGVVDVVLLDDGTMAELQGPISAHDAYIFFGRVACKEAVPIMIEALAPYEKPAATGASMLCTSAHLRAALVAQTGENFGYELASWRRWWEAKGKDLPEWFFREKVAEANKANQALQPTPTAGTSAAGQP